jgi:hypothetical protein
MSSSNNLDFTPIPESEQEKRIKKDIDFLEDMYNDEDYHNYVWVLARSQNQGKTFDIIDGFIPVGKKIACVDEQEIAPLASNFVIEPTRYKLAGILADSWKADTGHPVHLLKADDSLWEAPDDNEQKHTITIDLGEERVIGAIQVTPSVSGAYNFEILTSLNETDFNSRGHYMVGGSDLKVYDLALPYLVNDRYVQIVTSCKAIKHVQVLSMSENATQEEKANLSKHFYEEKAMMARRRAWGGGFARHRGKT